MPKYSTYFTLVGLISNFMCQIRFSQCFPFFFPLCFKSMCVYIHIYCLKHLLVTKGREKSLEKLMFLPCYLSALVPIPSVLVIAYVDSLLLTLAEPGQSPITCRAPWPLFPFAVCFNKKDSCILTRLFHYPHEIYFHLIKGDRRFSLCLYVAVKNDYSQAFL